MKANSPKKIVVVGIGDVGLSNAVLLAQSNKVTAVDLSSERVDMVNARRYPIIDPELEEFLANSDLELDVKTDLETALQGALSALLLVVKRHLPASTRHHFKSRMTL